MCMGSVGSQASNPATALHPLRDLHQSVEAEAEQHPDQCHRSGQCPGWAGARRWSEEGLLHQPLTPASTNPAPTGFRCPITTPAPGPFPALWFQMSETLAPCSLPHRALSSCSLQTPSFLLPALPPQIWPSNKAVFCTNVWPSCWFSYMPPFTSGPSEFLFPTTSILPPTPTTSQGQLPLEPCGLGTVPRGGERAHPSLCQPPGQVGEGDHGRGDLQGETKEITRQAPSGAQGPGAKN